MFTHRMILFEVWLHVSCSLSLSLSLSYVRTHTQKSINNNEEQRIKHKKKVVVSERTLWLQRDQHCHDLDVRFFLFIFKNQDFRLYYTTTVRVKRATKCNNNAGNRTKTLSLLLSSGLHSCCEHTHTFIHSATYEVQYTRFTFFTLFSICTPLTNAT